MKHVIYKSTVTINQAEIEKARAVMKGQKRTKTERDKEIIQDRWDERKQRRALQTELDNLTDEQYIQFAKGIIRRDFDVDIGMDGLSLSSTGCGCCSSDYKSVTSFAELLDVLNGDDWNDTFLKK